MTRTIKHKAQLMIDWIQLRIDGGADFSYWAETMGRLHKIIELNEYKADDLKFINLRVSAIKDDGTFEDFVKTGKI